MRIQSGHKQCAFNANQIRIMGIVWRGLCHWPRYRKEIALPKLTCCCSLTPGHNSSYWRDGPSPPWLPNLAYYSSSRRSNWSEKSGWQLKSHKRSILSDLCQIVWTPEMILQSTFSRILACSGWQERVNANRYNSATLRFHHWICSALCSSKPTLPYGCIDAWLGPLSSKLVNNCVIYIYYIGAWNRPIKLVRRGGIYFDVPPQCSTPDTTCMVNGYVAMDTVVPS